MSQISAANQHCEEVQIKSSGCRLRARACCSKLAKEWVLLATLSVILAAWADPAPAVRIYKPANRILLSLLFLVMGLEIDLAELRFALTAWHFHVSLQSFIFLLVPVLYWGCIHHWHVGEMLGLDPAFAAGTMAVMCLPTTTNTGVMFTQQAKGDVSVAAINAPAGNFIGAFVAPWIASFLLGGAVAQQDTSSVVSKLLQQVILPLIGGTLVQLGVRAVVHVPEALSNSIRAKLRLGNSAVLVIILYFIFCKAFDEKVSGVTVSSFSILVVYLIVLHLLLLGLAWLVATPFTLQRRISFVLLGSQKTEAMGVALCSVIFASDAANLSMYTLPIVVYHTVQLLIGASIIGVLRNLVDREETKADTKPDTTCDV